LEVLKNSPTEIWNNPLGKGAIGGSKIKIFNNTDLNPHNQYLSIALQGGVIALIAVLYFLRRLVFVIRNGKSLIINNNKNLSAIFSLALVYWITLLSIDFGGLFHQITLSIIFLLFNMNTPRIALKYSHIQ